MKVTFYKDKILFKEYPFKVASVYTRPELGVEEISEIRTHLRWPPEVVTKDKEVLFIPKNEVINLRLFAKINNIPDMHRNDVWGCLLEPYLDTQVSELMEKRIIQSLKKDGFTDEEITDIRGRIEKRMLQYNGIVWEWVHLGHFDALQALNSGFFFKGLNKEVYNWTNEISSRGRKQGRVYEDLHSEVDSKLSTLVFDILGPDVSRNQYENFENRLKELIIGCHSEPHRHYHNLHHILQVTTMCEKADASEKDKLILRIAAWFHDIIYDPKSADNEQQSADLMQEIMGQAGVNKSTIQKAANLILITKDHLSAKTKLEKIITDADMFIFSQSPDIYDTYAANVRKEYAAFSDHEFNTGRLGFLQSVKSHIEKTGHLFHTQHPLNEQLAMENIEREIASL